MNIELTLDKHAPEGMAQAILDIVKFNQLMKRVQYDRKQLAEQVIYLSDENHEFTVELVNEDKDKMLSELCDVVVVAVGGAYLAGWYDTVLRSMSGGDSTDIAVSVADVVAEYRNNEDPSSLAYDFMTVIEACMGFAIAEGLDLAGRLNEINQNNLGKFYGSLEDASHARMLLKIQGLNTEIRTTGDDVYQFGLYAKDNTPSVAKKYPNGKLMKHIDKFSKGGIAA